MADWLVNLIVGLFTAILGFIGGFFTKSYQVKNKQKAKGNNNRQTIGDNNINQEIKGNGNQITFANGVPIDKEKEFLIKIINEKRIFLDKLLTTVVKKMEKDEYINEEENDLYDQFLTIPVGCKMFNKIVEDFNKITMNYVPIIEHRYNGNVEDEKYRIMAEVMQFKANVITDLLSIEHKLSVDEITSKEIE